jgi:hypothetical protein
MDFFSSNRDSFGSLPMPSMFTLSSLVGSKCIALVLSTCNDIYFERIASRIEHKNFHPPIPGVFEYAGFADSSCRIDFGVRQDFIDPDDRFDVREVRNIRHQLAAMLSDRGAIIFFGINPESCAGSSSSQN